MKRIRIQQWRGQFLAPRSAPPTTSRATCLCSIRPRTHLLIRAHASPFSSQSSYRYASPANLSIGPGVKPSDLPSPLPGASLSSAKLAALHARLALPQRFPIQTLARTLVDRTADTDERFNNAALATLGADIMGYYMSEHLICHYPRLPMDVLFAAQEAYIGPKALMTIAKEWGVEEAAEPGGEVDPGYLQFMHALPEGQEKEPFQSLEAQVRLQKTRARNDSGDVHYRGLSSKIVYDDQFGNPIQPEPGHDGQIPTSTPQDANANFVRALMGALHLHTGRVAAKTFFTNHFLSRVLNLSQLFDFKYPTRDLSRLCLREGFEPPIARMISESGRMSSHPIFVVGVFSGRDKLGEAVGASLAEARTRAAAAALKGWYLYSPMKITAPSVTEDDGGKEFEPNMIDPGEIIH